jgi:hypothetical protein
LCYFSFLGIMLRSSIRIVKKKGKGKVTRHWRISVLELCLCRSRNNCGGGDLPTQHLYLSLKACILSFLVSWLCSVSPLLFSADGSNPKAKAFFSRDILSRWERSPWHHEATPG